MKINKKYLIILLIILLSSVFAGCIGEPKSRLTYTIFFTPSEGLETTLILPVIMDVNTGKIDEVMLADPRFAEGNGSSEIIETEKGPALKITTYEYVQIKFARFCNESSPELIPNKTLSMTNTTYDEMGYPLMTAWLYVNSTANQSRIWITMSVGAAKSRELEFGGRNISNGWHQFTVEEGYLYAD